jgi:hypothetical protein
MEQPLQHQQHAHASPQSIVQQQAGIAQQPAHLQQQQQQAPAGHQSIPRILHQNYLAGPQQLLADAMQPLSHFRKEWWLSCKVKTNTLFWLLQECAAEG